MCIVLRNEMACFAQNIMCVCLCVCVGVCVCMHMCNEWWERCKAKWGPTLDLSLISEALYSTGCSEIMFFGKPSLTTCCWYKCLFRATEIWHCDFPLSHAFSPRLWVLEGNIGLPSHANRVPGTQQVLEIFFELTYYTFYCVCATTSHTGENSEAWRY